MNGETIGTLSIAAVAVLGSIGSVLMLAYRVGKLSGEIGARMVGSETDRARLWQAIGALTDKLDRHIERYVRNGNP